MEETKDKKEFEISYVVRTENGLNAVKDLCTRHGGVLVSADEPRKIALAYPIKKEQYGFFGVIYANLDPESVIEIEKDSKLDQEILRILVISEPIKITQKEREDGDMQSRPRELKSEQREDQQNRDVQHEAETKRKQSDDRAVTNEELEKKLEEILG